MKAENIAKILSSILEYFAVSKNIKRLKFSWYFVYIAIANMMFFNTVYILLVKSIYYHGSFRAEVFSITSVLFIFSLSTVVKDLVGKLVLKFIKSH